MNVQKNIAKGYLPSPITGTSQSRQWNGRNLQEILTYHRKAFQQVCGCKTGNLSHYQLEA